MANIANVKVRQGNVLELSGSAVSISGSNGLNLHTQNGGINADAGTGKVRITGSAVEIKGNLVVDGNIEAHRLDIFVSETVVSSSVIRRDGSTRFGDTEGNFGVGDLHEFTGSVRITNELSASSLSGQLDKSNIAGLGEKQVLLGTADGSNEAREITGSSGIAVDYGTNGKIILTVASAGGDGFVTLSGDQTVNGVKLFTDISSQFTGSFSGSLGQFGTLTLGSELGVQYGGTGVDGSGATNGQLLIGNGSGYQLGNIASEDGSVTITNSEGGIDLSVDLANIDAAGLKNLNSFTELNTFNAVHITGSDGLLLDANAKLVASGSVIFRKSLDLEGILDVTAGNTGSVTGDHTVVLAADNVEIELPAVDTGRLLMVKRKDAGSSLKGVLIKPNGSEKIDGENEYGLYGAYQSVFLFGSGSSWFIL